MFPARARRRRGTRHLSELGESVSWLSGLANSRTGYLRLVKFAVLAAALLAGAVHAQSPLPPPIPRELRAVWVTPLDAMTGPDWPSRPDLTPDQQRAEFRLLLDRAKSMGLNAIVLHVRIGGDA